MRNPTLSVTHPTATKERLVALVEEVPGARVGVKVAALLLLLEGQRPGWTAEVLGVTRMSLSRWIHGVNGAGLEALTPKPRPGRPTRLAPRVQQALARHLEQPPHAFGLNRAVGRADGGGAPEAALRDRGASPTGAAVDAPPGVPPEAGQPRVPAGTSHSGPAVPAGVKKNWRPWARLRRWSSKTRPGLPCTRAWGGGGPDAASGFASQPPVSIGSG